MTDKTDKTKERVYSSLGDISTSDPDFARALRPSRPTVICLCGSTRFWREYQEANRDETLRGNIVLTVGFYMYPPQAQPLFPGLMETVLPAIKAELDELHLRKIDMADEVLFLNRDGYMGESTRRELAYAREKGKVIRFLESPAGS